MPEDIISVGLSVSELKVIITLLHDDAKFACEAEDWDTAYNRLFIAKAIQSELDSYNIGGY